MESRVGKLRTGCRRLARCVLRLSTPPLRLGAAATGLATPPVCTDTRWFRCLRPATLDALIRYARKIMRYLEEPADVRDLSRPELQAAVVLKLERAARELELKSEPGIPVDVPLLLGEDSLNHVTCVAPPPWLSGKLSRFHSVLASSDMPNRIYLIAANEEKIPACIAAAVDSESAACIYGTRDLVLLPASRGSSRALVAAPPTDDDGGARSPAPFRTVDGEDAPRRCVCVFHSDP